MKASGHQIRGREKNPGEGTSVMDLTLLAVSVCGEERRQVHRVLTGKVILSTQGLVSVKLDGLSYVSLNTCKTDERPV